MSNAPGRGPASLRMWLQSTTVLAVLAGYTVLVVLTVSLNRIGRRQEHQLLIDRVSEALIQRMTSARDFDRTIQQLLMPGLEVRLVPSLPETNRSCAGWGTGC